MTLGLYSIFYFSTRNVKHEFSKFIYLWAGPGLIISFLMFGIYPIFCQYIGLVRKTKKGIPKIERTRSRSQLINVLDSNYGANAGLQN